MPHCAVKVPRDVAVGWQASPVSWFVLGSQVAAAENETYVSANVTGTTGQTFAASKSFCSCSVVRDQLSWILPTNAHIAVAAHSRSGW